MKIRYVSDLHLGHEYYFKRDLFIPQGSKDEIIVIAGDQWETCNEFTHPSGFMKKMANTFKHVIFVAGNHDYYGGEIDDVDSNYLTLSKGFDNVHFLQNEVKYIDGIKFLGCTLWTDFICEDQFYNKERRLVDFNYLSDSTHIFKDNKPVRPDYILEKHLLSCEFLKHNMDDQSIVITHHNMTYKGMHDKWKAKPGVRHINHLFYSNLDELILDTRPKLVISGHTHDSYDVNIGNTRVVCNPRGYVNAYGYENKNFDWYKSVDV